ncbi:hypothetical protein ElyMa_006405200 [Elysia marginata]|uniref:MADF domain-containing protein n=1 Tax=Elysia marginata TaxID=1093978 RepID=A0AAV4HVY3_9GAST|nr:hypothetical protein ElyMa_006405200 [Elysia marginata]
MDYAIWDSLAEKFYIGQSVFSSKNGLKAKIKESWRKIADVSQLPTSRLRSLTAHSSRQGHYTDCSLTARAPRDSPSPQLTAPPGRTQPFAKKSEMSVRSR